MGVCSFQFRALGPGACIGVIALSQATEAQRVERACLWLSNQGFEVKLALDPSKHFGSTKHLFSSDSVKHRVKALHALYADKKVSAVLTVRGAYGSMEILNSIRYSALGGAKKPLIGLSDTTAVLMAMHRYAQIPVIHGPVVESLSRIGTEPQAEQNAVKLIRLLQGQDVQPFSGVKLTHIHGPKQAQGRLLAGNLSLLSALVGTPYAPKAAGAILCIEEVRESPYKVHRMLLQLKLAGVFERVRAVVFGSLRTCVHPKGLGPTVDDVIRDIFSDAKFPVYSGLPFGHEGDNFSIPLGIKAELSHNHLELLEAPVLN